MTSDTYTTECPNSESDGRWRWYVAASHDSTQ